MVKCIECYTTEALLTTGAEIYPHRKDLAALSFYICDNCGAYVGCHPGTTTALGSPAGPETRSARQQCHRLFDRHWKSGGMSRSEAYARISKALGFSVHFSQLTQEQCEQAITELKTWSTS